MDSTIDGVIEPLPNYVNPSGGLDSFTMQDALDRGEPLQGLDGTIYRRRPGEMVIPHGGNPLHPTSPQVPESFTPADDLELQKYQQALARVRQDKYDGDITDEDHAAVESEIQSRMAPLLQGKQRQMEQMQQLQETQLLRQSGMAQAIKHANEAHDAQFFPEKTPWLTDPMTGQSVALRPNGPSKWEEVQFPALGGQEAGEGDSGEGGGEETTFEGQPEGQTGGFAEPPRGQPRVKEAFQAAGGFKPTESQMQVQQAAAQGKGVSRLVLDQAKKDHDAQLGGNPRDSSLNQAQLNELWNRAANTVRLPPGPHRDQAVSHLFQHLVAEHTRRQQHLDDQQARQSLAGQRQAQREDQEATRKEMATAFRHHMGDLRREAAAAEKDKATGGSADVPDYLKSREAMTAEAKRRVQEEMDYAKEAKGGTVAKPVQAPNVKAQQEALSGLLKQLQPQVKPPKQYPKPELGGKPRTAPPRPPVGGGPVFINPNGGRSQEGVIPRSVIDAGGT